VSRPKGGVRISQFENLDTVQSLHLGLALNIPLGAPSIDSSQALCLVTASARQSAAASTQLAWLKDHAAPYSELHTNDLAADHFLALITALVS
jgi:hypothetical protein